MLLDDDIVANRQAKPGPFACRLGRKERVEHFVFDFRWDAGAVVPDSDLDPVAEAFGRGLQDRLEIAPICLRLTLGRGGLILVLTFVMCAGSGLLAVRKVKKVDPADVF